jgi:alanine racemase
VAPSALWAVVKADGYGHGAIEVARAALDAGAQGLCVALVSEGIELRAAGIDARSSCSANSRTDAVDDIVRFRLMATVYTAPFIEALAAAARARGVDGLPVHLKIDTGMQRVGVSIDRAAEVAASIESNTPTLRLVGVFTHLAMADEPDDDFTGVQLDRFDAALAALSLPSGVLVHVANSAGRSGAPRRTAVLRPSGHRDLRHLPGPWGRPAVSRAPAGALVAGSGVARQAGRAGSRISYGLRHTFEHDTTVATVPIGYADGVPRRLFAVGGEVLIRGRRRPIVGVVTMDQLMVDCGRRCGRRRRRRGADRAPGRCARVGTSGREDWADLLDTIGYEIVCGIGSRVPRRHGRSIGHAMLGREHA